MSTFKDYKISYSLLSESGISTIIVQAMNESDAELRFLSYMKKKNIPPDEIDITECIMIAETGIVIF